MRNACPHGYNGKKLVNGKPCANLHPERCIAYCKYGEDKTLGCSLGVNCLLMHPQLCPTSVSHRQCFTNNCRHIHLKGTKRKQDDLLNRINDTPHCTTSIQPTATSTPHSSSRHRRTSNPQDPKTCNEHLRSIKHATKIDKAVSTAPDDTIKPLSNSDLSRSHDTSFFVQLIQHVKADLLNHINMRLDTNLPVFLQRFSTHQQTVHRPSFPGQPARPTLPLPHIPPHPPLTRPGLYPPMNQFQSGVPVPNFLHQTRPLPYFPPHVQIQSPRSQINHPPQTSHIPVNRNQVPHSPTSSC